MKIYLCFTGWEEGSTVHHAYKDSKKAKAWEEKMKTQILPQLDKLVDAWSKSHVMEDDVYVHHNNKERTALNLFCKKHNLDSLDHAAWIYRMMLE